MSGDVVWKQYKSHGHLGLEEDNEKKKKSLTVVQKSKWPLISFS